MSNKTKLEVRQREIRAKLAELSNIESLTDEQRTEMQTLTKESIDNDAKLNALAVTEQEPQETTTDAESNEIRELRKKSRVSNYVVAASEMRSVDGAEREFNAALGLQPGAFPMELLAPSEDEMRTTTDTDTTSNQRRWIDRLFSASMARRMGVSFESVPVGQASYPVTTAGATGAQRGRDEAATAAAWSVGVTELKPTRNTVHLSFTIEDAARLPGLEQSLQRDMRSALMDSIDTSLFIGDNGANENGADITGFKTASITETTLTQANKVKADKIVEAYAAFIDGKHCEGFNEMNIVASVGSNALWLSTVHNSAVDNQTIAQYMQASGMSWMTRGGIDSATGNGKFGAYVGLARGIQGAAVAAVWSNGTLIRDPYTDANKGAVKVTLNYLWDFGIPRTSNFKRIKYVSKPCRETIY
ncbi:MAG: hypothetical protein OXL36_05460 [Bryobacterales bacterium]|nr:hypothetical protein [Bryobacterales bacterium]MDE0293894.1 hypothetical protein [Bryobacterales bacterium]